MADLADLRSRIILDTSQVEQGKQRVRQAFAEMGQAVRGLSQAQQEAAVRNRAWQQELNNEAAATRRAAAAKQQAASFERELAATKARLIEITEGEGRAAQSVAQKYSELSRVYRGQLVEVRQQIEAHEALAAAATKAAAAQARALTQARANVGRNLQTVGGALTGAVTTPLAVAGGLSVAAGVQVQGAEATLAGQTGAQGAALQGLDASFRRVAGTVPQTLKETAGAIATLYQRTRETGPALEGLAKTELDLSRITGENLGGQIKATTQAFAAWNITAAAQIPALDVLEKAHQQTGVSVSKLADSLARAAPTLRTWGIGFTEGAALLSSFEKAGIPADRFVMGLTQGIARLSKAGITDLHQALSIIIGDLTNAKNPAAAAAEAVRLFGARAGVQLADAVRTGKINVQALTQALEHSQGTIDKTALAAQTFGTRFRQAMNQATVAIAPVGLELLKIGVIALKALQPVIAKIGEVVQWFSKLSPTAREAIIGFLAFVAVQGPLLGAVGRIVQGVQGLSTAFKAVKLVITGAEGVPAIQASLAALGGSATAVAGIWALAFAGMTFGIYTLLGKLEETHPALRRFAQATGRLFGGGAGMGPRQTPQGNSLSMSSGGGDLGPDYHPLYADAPGFPGGAPTAAAQSQAAIRAALARIGQPKPRQPKRTEEDKESERATEKILTNLRIRQMLERGESVEVARLAGEYRHLSAAQLEQLVASDKATEKLIKAAESRKAYTKDLAELNAQIRRLAAGHAAEAGGLDMLKEKYPGLADAQYKAMEAARQWKLHLEEVRKVAEGIGKALHEAQAGVLTADALTHGQRAAAGQLGARFAEKFPNATFDQFWNSLTPDQQATFNRIAGKQDVGSLDQQLGAARERNETLRSPGGHINSLLYRRTREIFGRGEVPAGGERKVADLIRAQRDQTAAEAGVQLFDQQAQRVAEASGTSGVRVRDLREQFRAFIGPSAAARQVMEQFGVTLGKLPAAAQRNLRAFLDLQQGMKFLQDIAGGLQGVFENAFSNLSHGFRGFFQNVIQGFEGMLQQMAAKYLASQVANLFLRFAGGALGGLFGGAGITDMSQIVGHAAGGSFGAGRPMLVGEYGPELILPNRGGHVVPNAQLAGMGGGGMTVNFHVHGVTDAAGFRQNRGAIMSDLGRAIDRARRTHG